MNGPSLILCYSLRQRNANDACAAIGLSGKVRFHGLSLLVQTSLLLN